MTRAAIGFVLALLAGVYATPRAPAWQFVARVDGISVADSAGRAMAAPFLGGFDLPRPQLVDINGDGLLDLFVQEHSRALIYFERVGAEWVWRSDRFQDIDIGEWYRFVDVDADGRVDLFAEMPAGYIRLWRNTGTRSAPRFTASSDTIRDVDGRALVADRQNILNALDIDCNGRLDLFIGRVQGSVDRYEQEGTSPDGSPRFRLDEEMWQGIEVLGPEATGGALIRTDTTTPHGPSANTEMRRHGANTLAFADVDRKGTMDLFWGDFFEEGLLRFVNTGTCARPDLTGKPIRFPEGKPVLSSGYNAPTFGDVNGDSTVDLVMGVIGGAYGPSRTSINNLFLGVQAPKGTWTVTTRRLIPTIDVGSESAPTLGDLNGDGLLDLVVGSKIQPDDQLTGAVAWFENVGSRQQPSFRERGLLPITGQYNYTPAVVDLDGDSLPEIVLGTHTDRVQRYRNTGTRRAPVWTLADSAFVTISRGTNTAPAFGDLDGDGLVDLVIGEGSGTINLYRNTGTARAPAFTLVSDNFQEIKVGRRSAPQLADLDGDGRLDLFIGSDAGEVQLWLRLPGTEIRFARDTTFRVSSDGFAAPAVGDLRGTGRLDLVVGTGSGGLRYFENRTPR